MYHLQSKLALSPNNQELHIYDTSAKDVVPEVRACCALRPRPLHVIGCFDRAESVQRTAPPNNHERGLVASDQPDRHLLARPHCCRSLQTAAPHVHHLTDICAVWRFDDASGEWKPEMCVLKESGRAATQACWSPDGVAERIAQFWLLIGALCRRFSVRCCFRYRGYTCMQI